MSKCFDDTVGVVAERLAAVLRVAGSTYRELFQVWLFVYVRLYITFVNAPTIQEKFRVWGKVKKKKCYIRTVNSNLVYIPLCLEIKWQN